MLCKLMYNALIYTPATTSTTCHVLLTTLSKREIIESVAAAQIPPKEGHKGDWIQAKDTFPFPFLLLHKILFRQFFTLFVSYPPKTSFHKDSIC